MIHFTYLNKTGNTLIFHKQFQYAFYPLYAIHPYSKLLCCCCFFTNNQKTKKYIFTFFSFFVITRTKKYILAFILYNMFEHKRATWSLCFMSIYMYKLYVLYWIKKNQIHFFQLNKDVNKFLVYTGFIQIE